MELIDILDENGNKTDLIKSRNEVHKIGLWHKVMYLWIINSNNEILLQKRSYLKKTNPNMWTASSSRTYFI